DMVTGEETPVTLPKSNVVTLVLGDKGSVIVRPSGTEPKVKLYLTAVDLDQSKAKALLADLAEAMNAYVPK
ncbi:MAG: phospho-sugar mutase, partial [Clostridia bacterium]|nr:phospho-sugar mutase [Clostridia bacterium]